MKLIELTNKGGNFKFIINPQYVVGVDRDCEEDLAVIHMANGSRFVALETVEQIKEKLNEI